jgi:hypothetical protein
MKSQSIPTTFTADVNLDDWFQSQKK